MPDEERWSEFFNPEFILDVLGIKDLAGDIVDFGCGYGTFAIPAARRTKGTVYAIDLDGEMILSTAGKAKDQGIKNIAVITRDFFSEGTGLPDGCCEAALLFNILHAEEPLRILSEAKRILADDGKVAVIHWNYDPSTPRGPSMPIRPRPEQCAAWVREAGFIAGDIISLPPYHYGLAGRKVG